MTKILTGNWLMVVCSICYLAWWLITFKPPAPKGTSVGTLCLIGAFCSGLLGLFLTGTGMAIDEGLTGSGMANDEGITGSGVPMLWIIIAGIIMYAVLLILTRVLFHRQVTSELFIIVGWAVLEAALCNYMYALGRFTAKEALIYVGVILVTAVVSLICYILYYELPYVKGYIDGCIPLALCMIVMIILNLKIMRR